MLLIENSAEEDERRGFEVKSFGLGSDDLAVYEADDSFELLRRGEGLKPGKVCKQSVNDRFLGEALFKSAQESREELGLPIRSW